MTQAGFGGPDQRVKRQATEDIKGTEARDETGGGRRGDTGKVRAFNLAGWQSMAELHTATQCFREV